MLNFTTVFPILFLQKMISDLNQTHSMIQQQIAMETKPLHLLFLVTAVIFRTGCSLHLSLKTINTQGLINTVTPTWAIMDGLCVSLVLYSTQRRYVQVIDFTNHNQNVGRNCRTRSSLDATRPKPQQQPLD